MSGATSNFIKKAKIGANPPLRLVKIQADKKEINSWEPKEIKVIAPLERCRRQNKACSQDGQRPNCFTVEQE